jgi:hypothetical protein
LGIGEAREIAAIAAKAESAAKNQHKFPVRELATTQFFSGVLGQMRLAEQQFALCRKAHLEFLTESVESGSSIWVWGNNWSLREGGKLYPLGLEFRIGISLLYEAYAYTGDDFDSFQCLRESSE